RSGKLRFVLALATCPGCADRGAFPPDELRANGARRTAVARCDPGSLQRYLRRDRQTDPGTADRSAIAEDLEGAAWSPRGAINRGCTPGAMTRLTSSSRLPHSMVDNAMGDGAGISQCFARLALQTR